MYKICYIDVKCNFCQDVNQSHLDKTEVFRVNLLSPQSDRDENDDGSVVSERSLRGCVCVHLR